MAAWRAHLSDPAHETYCLRDADGTLVGFSLVLLGAAQGEDVGVVASDQRTRENLAELSKFYLLPRLRGTGAADLLMTGTLDALTGRGLSAVWLGTNAENVAAQRAYARHGFEVAGTRAYRVGGVVHDDVVMLRGL
ncbi:GNAT family N-acetyltransferase [Salana multivorans]